MSTDDHLSDFQHTGLLHLPGAVAELDTAAIVDRIWEHLDRSNGVARDRRETWTLDQPSGLRAITAEPQFNALGSSAVRSALDRVLGAGRWQTPRRWGRPLIAFPAGRRPWTLPTGGAWHNDFVPLRTDDGERAVQIFVILNDLDAHGGGTLILTGSHRLITQYIADTGEAPHPRRVRHALSDHPWLRELWEPPQASTDEERIHRYMIAGTRIRDADLRIVELTGRAGDAFVMHCDTLHAVAPNTSDEPRMMATNIITV
jgi:hypothetical protein